MGKKALPSSCFWFELNRVLILSIPSIFLFRHFRSIFGTFFVSRIVLDLLTNFFLHLLILEIAHLWPKFCYDSLSFEEEFLNQSFGFGLFFPFVLVCSSAGASSSGGLQRERAQLQGVASSAWRSGGGRDPLRSARGGAHQRRRASVGGSHRPAHARNQLLCLLPEHGTLQLGSAGPHAAHVSNKPTRQAACKPSEQIFFPLSFIFYMHISLLFDCMVRKIN